MGKSNASQYANFGSLPFYWRFAFRLFHFHLHGWTVARLAGYLDFGNLGLITLDCLA